MMVRERRRRWSEREVEGEERRWSVGGGGGV